MDLFQRLYYITVFQMTMPSEGDLKLTIFRHDNFLKYQYPDNSPPTILFKKPVTMATSLAALEHAFHPPLKKQRGLLS
jgi:hypothetical protein